MKATDLMFFIQENGIEYHWHGDDVMMFVHNYEIPEFHKILSSGIFDDEGIVTNMKDGYFCFQMKDICGYYGIDMNEVFKNKD